LAILDAASPSAQLDQLNMPTSHACLAPDNSTRDTLRAHYRAVRKHTLDLTQGLSAEDQGLQSMPDASPSKWHLAHTTWFLETLVLQAFDPSYRAFHAQFAYLFNSYYEALGPRHPRPQRALLSRPTLAEVLDYREHVDEAMLRFMAEADGETWRAAQDTLTLGLHHEQQHQELLLTDILHAFSCNPLLPACRPAGEPQHARPAPPMAWLKHPGGLVDIGHAGPGFAFDNEAPRHRTLLQPFEIADRLVNCADYLAFVLDGGYAQAGLWLSDGWQQVQAQGWRMPPYWLAPEDPRAPCAHWQVFGLAGVRALQPDEPVSQLSFYEAEAYARWAVARLPTEGEWEAASALPGFTQAQDCAWQWTRSSYQPYPGFVAFAGPATEYNAKFMVGQMVLRGGSLATPAGHARPSYRNFFPPQARWQFSGLRLARDPAATPSYT
jgi:ergothioneine biosynthesis protein EgtB